MSKQLLITGGTKGIGRAILEKFAEKGFNILTCARSEKDLRNLNIDFGFKFPGQELNFFAADLSKKEGRLSFCSYIQEKEFRPDVLINNTGVFIPGTIQEEEDGILEKTLETNLYSAYDITRCVISDMKEKKGSHIFNICSTASVTAYENGGSYCISKFALLGFSKVLREELKNKDVRVTSVLPGATLTPSWEGCLQAF